MNALLQLDTFLIGSHDAVEALEKKAQARLLVISDSHGDIDAVRRIITNFGSDCDALIFCGDGFCDIAACLEEAAGDEKFKELLPPVIAAVRGNGDSDSYPVVTVTDEDGPPLQRTVNAPDRAAFCAAGRNILVVHGHRHGVGWGTETLLSAAHTLDADMVFFGHTHRVFWEEHGGTLILNPGSCSNPRDGLPPAFALVSFPGGRERFTVEFFGLRKALFGNTEIIPLAI